MFENGKICRNGKNGEDRGMGLCNLKKNECGW